MMGMEEFIGEQADTDLGQDILKLRLIPYSLRMVETRKDKGWTQAELAQITGVPSGTISAIETLRMWPSESVQDEIVSALEKSKDYLFPQSLWEAVRSGLFGQRVKVLKDKEVGELTGSLEHKFQLAEAYRQLLPISTREEPPTDLRTQLLKSIATLKPREREIIIGRFGLGDSPPKSLRDMAKEYGVTPERIRQVEVKALRVLRHPSRSKALKDFLK